MNMHSHDCTVLHGIWSAALQVREFNSCKVLLLLIKFMRVYDLIGKSLKPYIG
jgi:hypothetical protein